MRRTVFIPFANLSFNSGDINSTGLVRADGAIHNGAGFLAPPPLFKPASGPFTAAAEASVEPTFGGVNLSTTDNGAFSIYLYSSNGQIHKIDVSGAPPWTISSAGNVGTPLLAGEGNFLAFGSYAIMAAGHANPMQKRIQGQASFEQMIESADEPRAKFCGILGQRVVLANIANTGSAGMPDPQPSLLWLGATNDIATFGNPVTHLAERTTFIPLNDNYGDIMGLSSGKRRAYVFKAAAVYSLDVGGSFGFQTDRIASELGCTESRSIVDFNDETFFWSTVGPGVVRQGQVLMLADGFWTARGMTKDSPPNAGFSILSSARDTANGIVFWLVKYQTYDFTYNSAVERPTDTVGTAATTYALIAYNTLSNQLSFVWRQRSEDGIPLVDEASPATAHSFRPICLIDRIPWSNRMQMEGVGLVGVESATTDPTGPRYPTLFLAGLPGSSFTPEWTYGQAATFETGLIPFNGDRFTKVQGVRPIARARRGRAIPPVSVGVRTCQKPWDVERRHGPFTIALHGDGRRGFITVPGVANEGFIGFDLTVDSRQTTPAAYAYLLSEIEGVEVEFDDGSAK